MISPESRSSFHFEIGMALLSVRNDHTKEKSCSLLVILDQINQGAPYTMLQNNAAQRIAIAELNLKAGLESITKSNYISAYNLSKTAISLLPENAWSSHHDLCLQLYFLLSKGAYAYKKVEEAKVRNHVFKVCHSSLNK
jgi:predicted ATPase